MCMLTGIYQKTRLTSWEAKVTSMVLNELLMSNCTSGNRDGVGMGTLDGELCKSAHAASDFCLTPDYNKWVRNHIGAPVIAHVRTTSTGVTAKDGSHPFRVGNILLAHNGTFTNYKSFLGEANIDDKDPVDSHVVAALLAKEVGSSELEPSHLLSVLDKMSGSYALLVGDVRNRAYWVVTGSCCLYEQDQGPLTVINTSKLNLQRVGGFMQGFSDLLFQKPWELGELSQIPAYTIHKLTKTGLEQVEEVPKPKAVVTGYYGSYNRGIGSRGVMTNSTGVVGNTTFDDDGITVEQAKKRAQAMLALSEQWPVTDSEIRLAVHMLFKAHWTEESADSLNLVRETFQDIFEGHVTPRKELLWDRIALLCDNTPYTTLAKLGDVRFPWPLNTEEELEELLVIAIHAVEQKTTQVIL